MASETRRPGPFGMLMRRWLLLMSAVVPTIGVGLLLHAWVSGGSLAGQLARLYGYHLTILAVVAGVTFLLVLAASRVIGGAAGMREGDLSDLRGRDLAKRFLMVSPVYLIITGGWMAIYNDDPGMVVMIGLAALTPATIEDFLSSMSEYR